MHEYVLCYNNFRVFENITEDQELVDEAELEDLDGLLNMHNIEDAEDQIILPPHARCVSHTLNLVATKDSEEALKKDVSFKKIHRSTFGKCSKLWSKQNQSTQLADEIKDICGVYLKKPVITR